MTRLIPVPGHDTGSVSHSRELHVLHVLVLGWVYSTVLLALLLVVVTAVQRGADLVARLAPALRRRATDAAVAAAELEPRADLARAS